MYIYTKFYLNATLKGDTPQNVIDILKYMVGDGPRPKVTRPKHSFFATARWHGILFYFESKKMKQSSLVYEDIMCWHLYVNANVRNYSQQIERFIDWLQPYISEPEGAFLGFYKSDGEDDPTLIYNLPDIEGNTYDFDVDTPPPKS